MQTGLIEEPTGQAEAQSHDARRLKSEELLRGLQRIVIEHEGMEYTLQLTRQNKLLLTK